MAREQLARASKTQALVNMATMSHRTSWPRRRSHSHNLKIRIPKDIWNACRPRSISSINTREGRVHAPTLRLKLRLPARHVEPQQQSSTHDGVFRQQDPRPTQPASCKVRLWSFHHGGPKRATKGALQNEITYETPCLRRTCTTCQRWHPHLLQAGTSTLTWTEHELNTSARSIEPISPEIDPRILDGTWRDYQSRRGSDRSTTSVAHSAMSTTTVLTPAIGSFVDDPHLPDREPPAQSIYYADSPPSLQTSWNIFLPTHLVEQTATGAPAKTRWRSAPRRRYTVHLSFRTYDGRRKFSQVLLGLEKKARKREYDRAYRARWKLAREVRHTYDV
ncbi:hypothetical protein EK21DRAFT_92583 [Setomelanomma holmii]|uniref:Uncharacterized protein n=1 Tax=Setomelanomma holmii TaxID=210430 RepID=A0A9P4LJP6_9PLEO|nr:hypothetical protein EK21DRAFT_92583 [Setomelanomma holmii]